jgi:glycosyltransferase involved in cell wall biosynthesis
MSLPKHILVLTMFDLSRLDRAMAVRPHNLHNSLQCLTPTEMISGGWMPRRREILRYLLHGGLRETRAVYVEASTTTATEADLLFLALLRLAGVPILIFIPDAYQRFPDIFRRSGLKVKMLDWGWRRSIAAYQRLADRLFFPSLGLAACFDNRPPIDVLPPGGLAGREPALVTAGPPTVVYIGATSHRYGSDLLLDAMEQVVARHPTARCRFITADASYLDGHPSRHAPWLTVERRSFDELAEVMRSATLAVIPLRSNPYNDLAMPVKLFDCMAFGLPQVVTNCRDMAALVEETDAGLVVQDSVDGLAQGMIHLLQDRDLAARLGQNAYQAVQTAHSWGHRAARILAAIEQIEQERRDAHPAR